MLRMGSEMMPYTPGQIDYAEECTAGSLPGCVKNDLWTHMSTPVMSFVINARVRGLALAQRRKHARKKKEKNGNRYYRQLFFPRSVCVSCMALHPILCSSTSGEVVFMEI